MAEDDCDGGNPSSTAVGSAFRSFFAVLSDLATTGTTDALDYPRLDATALVAAARQRAAQTVGPRRSDEEVDRYRVRVFAELLGECAGHEDESDGGRRRRDATLLYARHAAETGDVATARRWHLQSVVTTADEDNAKGNVL